jgi:SAM-dependent methyltransferase
VAELTSWVPDGLDLERPSGARIYDYLLGGGHNFAHDRELAEKFLKAQPNAREIARLNRAFLRRAVLFMIDNGIRQFLDLGSGIPTVGNVHEIAQQSNPRARVVYADVEPVAVAHSTALLADNPAATAIQADLRDPDSVLKSEVVRGMLDFDRPIGLLMVAVLHFVPDTDQPHEAIAQYRETVAPGSFLAISHGTWDGVSQEGQETGEQVNAIYRRTDSPLVLRSGEEVAAFFTGLDVVEPGVVQLSEWRPDSDDAFISAYAGVGRKP